MNNESGTPNNLFIFLMFKIRLIPKTNRYNVVHSTIIYFHFRNKHVK